MNTNTQEKYAATIASIITAQVLFCTNVYAKSMQVAKAIKWIDEHFPVGDILHNILICVGFVATGIIVLWNIKKYIIPMVKATNYQEEMAYIASHNGQKYYDYSKRALEVAKNVFNKLHHICVRFAAWVRNVF